ncbi:Cell death protease [Allomyces arbusculus]|nr:Cell death protease [Allomyces arbusculus]
MDQQHRPRTRRGPRQRWRQSASASTWLTAALVCALAVVHLETARIGVVAVAKAQSIGQRSGTYGFYIDKLQHACNVERTRPFSIVNLRDANDLRVLIHIIANEKDGKPDKRIFFWLVEKEKQALRVDKTIIWLNGGPGCSSIEGMLLENGPFLVESDGSLTKNAHSWHKHANVLYVDQPAGTGFSTGSKATNQKEIAADFVLFLKGFFDVFPQLQYLAGESYAGTYIPYIATAILERNQQTNTTVTATAATLPWRLDGLLIGNGWMDAVAQYRSYIDFAVQRGLLSGSFLSAAELKWDSCKRDLAALGNPVRADSCELISEQVMSQSRDGGQMCINAYDIRLRDHGPEDNCGAAWPPTLPGTYKFLRTPAIVDFIHAKGTGGAGSSAWVECASDVYSALQYDMSASAVTLLPALLKHVRVYLYSGDQDYICNHLGTERMVDRLEWNGHVGWPAAGLDVRKVAVQGRVFGQRQQADNLTYVRVFNASHMVPINEPAGMLALVHDLLRVEALVDAVATSPTDVVTPGPIGNGSESTFGSMFIRGLATGLALSALFAAAIVLIGRRMPWLRHRVGATGRRVRARGLAGMSGKTKWSGDAMAVPVLDAGAQSDGGSEYGLDDEETGVLFEVGSTASPTLHPAGVAGDATELKPLAVGRAGAGSSGSGTPALSGWGR